MDAKIYSGGGKRVIAECEGFVIETDQSEKNGGRGSAPEPFDLFVASLGTCAGAYVYSYCQSREVPVDGIGLTQRISRNEKTKKIEKVELEIRLPAGFPDRHRAGLVRSAGVCSVKKQLDPSIEFEITTVVGGDARG